MKNFFKRRHQNYYQENIWHLIADITLVLVIIALIAFLIYSRNINRNKNVSLEMRTDNQSIIVGQLKSFELDYKINNNLKDIRASLVLPRNFILESVSPASLFDQEKNIFYLGDLHHGTTGKLKIDGYVVGEKDDHQMISFTFNCNKCGKNGILSSYFYYINRYFLDFNIDLPEKIYNNSDFETKLNIKNNASRDLENIIIELSNDLSLIKSDFEIKENKIFIENIKAKESREIKLISLVRDREKMELDPKISFDFIDRNYSFNDNKINREIKEPELKLNLSSDDSNIADGDYIDYKLNFSNQNSLAIKNIDINLSSANPNFSIEDIKFSTNNKNVSMDKNKLIKIEDLVEHESGEINLSVKFIRNQLTATQEIFLKADVKYEVNGQIISLTSYSNKNKLNSQLSGSVSARYYSPQGDQLGVGPLPPAVDMATNYWLFLEFNNSGNTLKDFILTAELPDNVYFSGNKRVLDGKLDYAEIGKRIVWEISEISAEENKYRANLEIIFIPEPGDLGNVVDLVKNIKFTVYDEFTQEEINKNLSNITSNLEGDIFSSGKGRVVIMR